MNIYDYFTAYRIHPGFLSPPPSLFVHLLKAFILLPNLILFLSPLSIFLVLRHLPLHHPMVV